MSALTLIQSTRPSVVCKTYRRSADGEIHKAAVAHVTEGTGRTVSVGDAEAMAALLREVTESRNLVLCNGTFDGAGAVDFRLVAESTLAKVTGTSVGQAPGGVQTVEGQRVAARLKRGVAPSAWLLLDCDNPLGIPDDWRAMGIEDRVKLLEPVLQGISACERIELRSSSARVHRPGEAPGPASHAWVRVSHPDLIETMRAATRVAMVNNKLSFPSPRYSRTEPGKVIGYEPRTVVDLATWDRGRLVFCARPEVAADTGLVVTDAAVEVVNAGAGAFNNGHFTIPVASDLAAYREATGRKLRIRHGATGITTDE
ncbi:hypothetical protein [Muricoccus radiodurans]|uniref:hypothetical protein n=1 Tax=Muricoccus radiodurans TaxID=2231721 RepID=UPI003CEB8E78